MTDTTSAPATEAAPDTSVHSGGPAPGPLAHPPRAVRRPRLAHADFTTTWQAEGAALNSTAKRVGVALGLVVLVILPFHVGEDIVQILLLSSIAVVGAVGLNIVSGAAGQLTLGHAGFIGLGAYTAGWATTDNGWPFYLSLPLAAVIGGLVGVVLAPVALRVRGLYLAVVTLGLVYVLAHLFRTSEGLTGGTSGKRVSSPALFGTDLVRGGEILGLQVGRGIGYYLLCLAIAVLAVVVGRNLLKGRTGRDFAVIRDQDIAAGILGVDPFRARTQAFVVSSALAAVTGALTAGNLRFISFDQWGLLLSVQYLAMVVIGGLGTVAGAVLGAVFVTALPTMVDRTSGVLPFISDDASRGLTPDRLSAVIYGALLVVVMIAEPAGLNGLLRRLRNVVTSWPFRV